jgi:putative ABC transport system substrate-binding protein
LPRLFQKLAAGLPPSQVPIEMPSRIDLVINLGVARAIGLNVPESLLAQASEVVDPA